MADTHDVIVIGAGAAGLTAAGGCAMFGLRVALIERRAMGGECLNTGCVPSKSLIAAAAQAEAVRRSARFGIENNSLHIDFAKVRDHVREAIAAIAPHDGREHFEALGVEVLAGEAHFTDDRTIEVGGRRLAAPRIVIATGSRPAIPPVPGLADVQPLTNETLFDLHELPRGLAILGGGPVGAEMAQAFRRLGSEVVVIEAETFLPHSDPEAAASILERLRCEGVEICEHSNVERGSRDGADILLHLDDSPPLRASHLLVATGRKPELPPGLDKAGVRAAPDGIIVDRRRRTSAKGVYAIGDCRTGPRLTDASGRDGAAVALAIATGWPASVDDARLPLRCLHRPRTRANRPNRGGGTPLLQARCGSQVGVRRQ